MSPFWASFFEHMRGCGRHAALFLMALPALLVLIAIGVSLDQAFPQARVPALSVIACCALAWLFAVIRRARTRRRQRLERQPLSDNEWRIARSKLRRAGRR